MKNKKTAIRLLAVLLCACMVIGCGSSKSVPNTNKLNIVTTIYPPYDFVKNVGGDMVEVTMLLKPGMESHSYEPTPADIIKIMHSDIFLYAGGESDVWVEDLLSAGESDTRPFALLDWVDPIEEETVEGMQTKGHSHDHGDHDHTNETAYDEHGEVCTQDHVHGDEEYHHDDETQVNAVHLHEEEYDEHVWTSPQNAMLIVEKICDIFGEMDPDNRAVYEENAEEYLKKLQELDYAFWDVVNKAERKTLVFGDRFPLLYFVRNYGLDYYAAFPGCSMETEASAATVAFLTDKVEAEEIPVIFYLELSNGKIAEVIAECTEAETARFYSGHAVTADDLEAGEDYLSLMYRNVDTLKRALGEK